MENYIILLNMFLSRRIWIVIIAKMVNAPGEYVEHFLEFTAFTGPLQTLLLGVLALYVSMVSTFTKNFEMR
jgi:hypothetical protein